jgi:hypothetical protein
METCRGPPIGLPHNQQQYPHPLWATETSGGGLAATGRDWKETL